MIAEPRVMAKAACAHSRRGVLEQLWRADASITDLADKFHMTLTGIKKHVGVLEQAGLVTTAKVVTRARAVQAVVGASMTTIAGSTLARRIQFPDDEYQIA